MLKRLLLLLIIIFFVPIITSAKCQTFNPASGVGCDSENNIYFCRGVCNSVAASSSLVTFCADPATIPNSSVAPGYSATGASSYYCGIPESCSSGYTLCRASSLSTAPTSSAGDWYDVRCKTNFSPSSGQPGYVAGCSGYNTCTEKCSSCSSGSYCSSSNTCGPSCTWPQSWDATNCVCAGSATTLKLGADSVSGSNIVQSANSTYSALFINSSNQVGIGTSTPALGIKLHLYDAASGPIISLSGLTSNYRGVSVRNTTNVEQFFYGLNNSSNFVLRASGATDLLTASTTAFALAINSTPTTGLLINTPVNIGGSPDTLLNLSYLSGQGTRFLTVGNDGGVLGSSILSVNSGILTVNGGTSISGNLVISGDLSVSNKLTVKTIDPLYDIFGTKYSTFAPSVVGGVKEEISGKISLNKKIGEEYQAVIDFDKQIIGSDLWVWRQVIDFSKENVEVSLTPYGRFARTYYYINNNSIVLRSDVPVEVSYNFSGKRFDWRSWPTKATNQSEKPSLIIR